MAEAVAEPENPFAQFVVPDTSAPAGGQEEPNPFAQFVPGADVAEAKPAAKPLSRVVHVTEEGFPIFEDEEDNRAARSAVANLFKSLPLGIAKGIHEVPMAINQMSAHAIESVLPEGSRAREFMADQRRRVDEEIAQTEQAYKETRGEDAGPDVGRLAGNFASTAPLAALVPEIPAAGALMRTAGRVVTGGTGGAIAGPTSSPVEVQPGESFAQKKGEQAGAGAVGGAIAAPILGALGSIINPNVRPEVRTLMDVGVTPTPGQIRGGVTNRLEEAAQSIPFVGDAIKAARGRATEDLNRASINRSLEPIGEKLNAKTPLGREAIGEMHEKIGANYDRLVPQLNVKADAQFVNDLRTNIVPLRAKMSDPAREQFDRILDNDVSNKWDAAGRMTGEQFKTVESELGRQARSFSNSAVASDRQIGQAFSQLQQHFRELLVRSNPDRAAELRGANEAFAHALRVEGAAAKSGTDQGVFTPAQLLQSVRQLDPSLRKNVYARGDALMQELADAGKTVLGNKVPDSGTPLRSAVIAAPTLAALYQYNPMLAAGVAGGGGAAMSAYSRPGTSLLASLLARRGPLAGPTANAVRWPGNVSLPAILAARQVEEGGRQ